MRRTMVKITRTIVWGILLTACALGSFAIIPKLHARDMGALGGGGGVEFRSKCRPNDVIIGFNMRSGKALDAIVPICQGLNPQKTGWADSAYEPSGYFGGGGGSYQKIDCNPGFVVRHLHVYMDKFKAVNHIRMTCQKLDSGEWHNSVPRRIEGAAIGDVRFSCIDGEWATGIYGRAGSLVDQLGLQCDPLAVSPPAPPAPNPPPAQPPAPNPPPAQPPDPNPNPAKTATVVLGVDVYNAPGGTGQQIGVLNVNTVVTLVAPCRPDNWCNVQGNNVPQGIGWVYSGPDYQSLKF